MPEFFGERFRSKGLRIAAAAIIFVFLIPYTASVYNGLSRLFGMAFGLPYEVCVIGMAVVTCIYVVVGGYMATVMNDFLQGIVMLIGIVAVVAAVLVNNGGFTQAITDLSSLSSELSPMEGPFTSMFGPDPLNLLGVVILTSLGTWGLPQMVQKFYAIKSGPAVKQGAIISTLFAFVVAGGSYFLGGFGQLYADQVEMGANGQPVCQTPSSPPCSPPYPIFLSESLLCWCFPPPCPRFPRSCSPRRARSRSTSSRATW